MSEEIDLSETIVPKSDQLNADDLITGSKTILITEIRLKKSDQPVEIHFNGGDGKPYKPCKSMRRALVQVWGSDGNKYVGQSLTLYLDQKVKWAGKEVGGIRISHMSGIDTPKTLLLTSSKGKREPFKIQPLVLEKQEPTKSKEEKAIEWVKAASNSIKECGDMNDLADFQSENEKIIESLKKYDSAANLLNQIVTDQIKLLEGAE